jgi:hypothetical protein
MHAPCANTCVELYRAGQAMWCPAKQHIHHMLQSEDAELLVPAPSKAATNPSTQLQCSYPPCHTLPASLPYLELLYLLLECCHLGR